jgi:hypothetical protein
VGTWYFNGYLSEIFTLKRDAGQWRYRIFHNTQRAVAMFVVPLLHSQMSLFGHMPEGCGLPIRHFSRHTSALCAICIQEPNPKSHDRVEVA